MKQPFQKTLFFAQKAEIKIGTHFAIVPMKEIN
jgi:hypothetical protein